MATLAIKERTTGRHRASIVLPTMLGVMAEMQPDKATHLPRGAGTFGCTRRNKPIAPPHLDPLASRTKEYLLRALRAFVEKHLDRANGGNDSWRLFCICSFLDPRFKDLRFLSSSERDETYLAANQALGRVAFQMQRLEVEQVKPEKRAAASGSGARQATLKCSPRAIRIEHPEMEEFPTSAV